MTTGQWAVFGEMLTDRPEEQTDEPTSSPGADHDHVCDPVVFEEPERAAPSSTATSIGPRSGPSTSSSSFSATWRASASKVRPASGGWLGVQGSGGKDQHVTTCRSRPRRSASSAAQRSAAGKVRSRRPRRRSNPGEPSRLVVEVLDHGVWAGKDQAFVAVVAPAHHPGWLAVSAVDLKDLGVSVGFPEVVALDHQPIPHCCSHGTFCCVDASGTSCGCGQQGRRSQLFSDPGR